jgi:hypothetical protein
MIKCMIDNYFKKNKIKVNIKKNKSWTLLRLNELF